MESLSHDEARQLCSRVRRGFQRQRRQAEKQRDLESGISALVERAAPLEEIVAQLGAPYHIYTRDEVQGFLVKTPERDVAVRETWTLLSQYPETLL